jgi:hypothetical protein
MFEIDLHFVCECVAVGDVRVLHVLTSSQFVNIFTKGLPSLVFLELVQSQHLQWLEFRLWGVLEN